MPGSGVVPLSATPSTVEGSSFFVIGLIDLAPACCPDEIRIDSRMAHSAHPGSAARMKKVRVRYRRLNKLLSFLPGEMQTNDELYEPGLMLLIVGGRDTTSLFIQKTANGRRSI